MEVPVRFELTTILQSRDAVSGAVYKTEALPKLSYETKTKFIFTLLYFKLFPQN